MLQLLKDHPFIIVSGTIIITAYYIVLIIYDRNLKKRENINIINEKDTSVKNIHIFENIFESAPSYNNAKLKPAIQKMDSKPATDWRKTLEEIQSQADELKTNNSLDQFFLDNNIDLED